MNSQRIAAILRQEEEYSLLTKFHAHNDVSPKAQSCGKVVFLYTTSCEGDFGYLVFTGYCKALSVFGFYSSCRTFPDCHTLG